MNRCILALSIFIFATHTHALEKIYDVSIKDTKPAIVEKFKAANIKVDVADNLSIDFDTVQTFTPTESDLFEKIESSGTRDVVDSRIILGDPKTGRVFHLNRELKVAQIDLIEPWTTKEKLKNLKMILSEMKSYKIEKIKGKKK